MARTVFPGELLGYLEEYLPGYGTYVDDNKIYASVMGEVKVDNRKKEISVVPSKKIRLVRDGEFLYGIVAEVYEKYILVQIPSFKRKNERVICPYTFGMLPIQNIKRGFVKATIAEFRNGDIVKVYVEKSSAGLILSTKHPRTGVILAFSPYGEALKLVKTGILKDPTTSRTEKRKVSSEYGKVLEFLDVEFR